MWRKSRCESGTVERAEECLPRKPRLLDKVFVRASDANKSDDGAGRRPSGSVTRTIGTMNVAPSVLGPSDTRSTGRNIAGSTPSTPSVIADSNVIAIGAVAR